MNYYRPKQCDIVARQITIENMEELASWCRGAIKGTKLPAERREIEIYTVDAEYSAEVGDFLVYNVDTDSFSVCSEKDFHKMYEKI